MTIQNMQHYLKVAEEIKTNWLNDIKNINDLADFLQLYKINSNEEFEECYVFCVNLNDHLELLFENEVENNILESYKLFPINEKINFINSYLKVNNRNELIKLDKYYLMLDDEYGTNYNHLSNLLIKKYFILSELNDKYDIETITDFLNEYNIETHYQFKQKIEIFPCEYGNTNNFDDFFNNFIDEKYKNKDTKILIKTIINRDIELIEVSNILNDFWEKTKKPYRIDLDSFDNYIIFVKS
ncbi:MAG: hypothetical protein LBM96_06065 [Methanobrevibacter sp.]|jgi:hypothetical protein|nr:hypothetical protein [Candidatus Methanoflexus mossambicus]